MSNQLHRAARRILSGAAAITVLVSGAWADVPGAFPSHYATHSTDRITITATVGGRTVTQRERREADFTMVFDDASNLHFEGAVAYPMAATWRPVSRRVATFRLTPETIDAYRAYASDLMQVEGPMRVDARPGRMQFSNDGTTFRATLRSTVRFRMRGVSVSLGESALFEGVVVGD